LEYFVFSQGQQVSKLVSATKQQHFFSQFGLKNIELRIIDSQL